jgi:acyl-CoA synthetase (AMP-forming)/AMP-acid ligase II
MTHLPTSLVDILRWRAKNQHDRLAYRFLVDGEFDEVVLTYEELDRRARSIAALLQSSAKAGDRALLLFPPGLDFIAAYFGCLYARIMAIPVYPPHPARLEKTVPIIRRIAADAKPSVALLTSSLFDGFKSQNAIWEELGEIKLLATDNNEMDDWVDKWQQPEIGGNDIAFLQYTSGSTTLPKGVIVSHSNLLHNLGLIEESFGLTSKSHTVFWLPPYHDMGLIGGILQSLYTGYAVTLFPHLMFLQRPIRWLQAISRFHATCSGGPNFAYDLCIRKIKPEQRAQLDLSSWEVAFNGAEPVYYKTLDQFADYFAPCGFRREAFLPCYGLAEATLMVVGGPKGRSPMIRHLVSSGLEQNHAIISPAMSEETRTLVGCGQNICDQKIRIIDAETLKPCPADRVGEIWVSGPSVANGYWNKPSETEFTFSASLSDSNEGPFLRTGDLGFLNEGELYITGRLKDLIICDGNNHYPHDIERTVEICHPAIPPAGSAAFSVSNSVGERVVIIVEIELNLEVRAEEVIKSIRKAVAMHHDLHVDDIRFIRAGTIPRTTSGKIKHYVCKTNYMAGTLKEIVLI